jgi:hypothetical protein
VQCTDRDARTNSWQRHGAQTDAQKGRGESGAVFVCLLLCPCAVCLVPVAAAPFASALRPCPSFALAALRDTNAQLNEQRKHETSPHTGEKHRGRGHQRIRRGLVGRGVQRVPFRRAALGLLVGAAERTPAQPSSTGDDPNARGKHKTTNHTGRAEQRGTRGCATAGRHFSEERAADGCCSSLRLSLSCSDGA